MTKKKKTKEELSITAKEEYNPSFHDLNFALSSFTVSSLVPMKHSAATDSISNINKSAAFTRDPITNIISLTTRSGVSYEIIVEEEKKPIQVKISADKLLKVSQFEFTNGVRKAYDSEGNLIIDPKISFSLEKYAALRGVDISTPSRKKEFKKEIKEDLLSFNKIKVLVNDPVNDITGFIQMISSGFIQGNTITVNFDRDFAYHLYKQPITQFPPELLSIDGRADNAYNIGKRIYKHAFMEPNILNGNANRLSVKTLLKETNLKTYEEILKSGQSWNERLKNPLDKAIDQLEEKGMIKNPEYRKPGGDRLSDHELEFNNYNDWIDTVLYFDLPDKYKKKQNEILMKSKKKTKKEKSGNEPKTNRKR